MPQKKNCEENPHYASGSSLLSLAAQPSPGDALGQLLVLPVRNSCLGIVNPGTTAEKKHQASMRAV